MSDKPLILKTMKAILRKGEIKAYAYSACGKQTIIAPGCEYEFTYGDGDTFFIVIDGVQYEEVSTAFDFVND